VRAKKEVRGIEGDKTNWDNVSKCDTEIAAQSLTAIKDFELFA
jgi:hypothetical protein